MNDTEVMFNKKRSYSTFRPSSLPSKIISRNRYQLSHGYDSPKNVISDKVLLAAGLYAG